MWVQQSKLGDSVPSGFLTVCPQRNSSLPDENNVARLQEELKALKVREGEAVASARELKQQLQELSDTWQVRAKGQGASSRMCLKHPGPYFGTHRRLTLASRTLPPCLLGPSFPRWPLEGVPAEAGPGRVTGRAHDCAFARGTGPG